MGILAGHSMDPDPQKRTPADPPDAWHETTDQKVGGSSPSEHTSERARSEALPVPGRAFLLTDLLTAEPGAGMALAKMSAASASCSLTRRAG